MTRRLAILLLLATPALAVEQPIVPLAPPAGPREPFNDDGGNYPHAEPARPPAAQGAPHRAKPPPRVIWHYRSYYTDEPPPPMRPPIDSWPQTQAYRPYKPYKWTAPKSTRPRFPSQAGVWPSERAP